MPAFIKLNIVTRTKTIDPAIVDVAGFLMVPAADDEAPALTNLVSIVSEDSFSVIESLDEIQERLQFNGHPVA